MAQRRLSQPEPLQPPLRPRLAEQPSRFVLLEREVELEYRPQMLEALQRKVNAVAEEASAMAPECPRCRQPMSYHDCSPGVMARPLGEASGLSSAVSLFGLQTGKPALVGSSGCRAWAHLWFVGSTVGAAGRRGALRTGGAVGAVAMGSDRQRHGCMAGGTALGAGGGQLQ